MTKVRHQNKLIDIGVSEGISFSNAVLLDSNTSIKEKVEKIVQDILGKLRGSLHE